MFKMTEKMPIFEYIIFGVIPNGFKTYLRSNERIGGIDESLRLYHPIRSLEFLFMQNIKTVYYNMMQRCYNVKNPGYKRYGGRGISVCQEWRNDINVFLHWSLSNGYLAGLQLDRRENNGNYEPGNCRYVTRKVNNNNTRSNVRLSLDGTVKTVAEWEEETSITRSSIKHRLTHGWEIADALSTPTKNTEVIIEYRGDGKSIAEWGRIFGIPHDTLWRRLNVRKWPIEKALETPVKEVGKKYEFCGELLSAKEISCLTNINLDTIYNRLQKGKNIYEAVLPTIKKSSQ